MFPVQHCLPINNDFTCFWINNMLSDNSSIQPASKSLTGNIIRTADNHPVFCTAIEIIDYEVLSNVHQSTAMPWSTYSYGSQPYPASPHPSPHELRISKAPVVFASLQVSFWILTLSS